MTAAGPHRKSREEIGRYASYDSAMVVMEVDSPMNTSEFPKDEKQVLSDQLFNLINKIDETLDQRDSALILNSFAATTPDLKRSIAKSIDRMDVMQLSTMQTLRKQLEELRNDVDENEKKELLNKESQKKLMSKISLLIVEADQTHREE